MDLAGNAAGNGAADAGAATAATNKALQLPPNTKNAVLETITSAAEGLATIVTALQDAEEGEGVPMPEELLSAIDQIGMQLCSFAEQHSQTANADPAVTMSVDEAAIANALVDGAPEIAKAFTAKMSFGTSVKKAAMKVAPAQMVGLLKELIEDFMARAQKWGPLFSGDGSAVAEPVAPAAAPAAAKSTDARATLKSVATNASARVAKALGEPTPNTTTTNAPAADMVEIMKALQSLPNLKAQIVRLEKSLVGGGLGDPLDDPSLNNDETEKYAPGENMSASIRKSMASTKRHVRDDEDDDTDV
jgi:hypothetical protein